jgi:hypothetical protein
VSAGPFVQLARSGVGLLAQPSSYWPNSVAMRELQTCSDGEHGGIGTPIGERCGRDGYDQIRALLIDQATRVAVVSLLLAKVS